MPNTKLKIAALGDLHTHEHSHELYKETFIQASKEADILALCGDLTNTGLIAEAKNLARDLSFCSIPVIGVLGNHDHHFEQPDEIKKILSDAGVNFLEGEHFEFQGVGFAGVKGFGGGFDNHILGAFGEKSIKDFVAEAINEALLLENSLNTLETEKKVVIMHYSPSSSTVRGEPEEIFPFLGCSRFSETLDRFDIAAVFHGHAHHGTLEGSTLKGIPVFNCALDVLKKTNRKYFLFEI